MRAQLDATIGDDQAEVAEVRAQLEQAQWELDQTTLYAPADGYAINVQMRPGTMTAAFPVTPVMTFVEDEYQVIALFAPERAAPDRAGRRSRVHAADLPRTDHQGQGRFDHLGAGPGSDALISGTLPQTGMAPIPPNRFPVKLDVDPKYRDLFLAAGAVGHGAVYTQSGAMIHIVRKVILRVGAKLDYLVLKLH